jgi:hypothetical protein
LLAAYVTAAAASATAADVSADAASASATAAEDAVDAVEEAADNLITRITANLFKPTGNTADARLSAAGAVEFSSGGSITDYLPVLPSTTYTVVKFADSGGVAVNGNISAQTVRVNRYDAGLVHQAGTGSSTVSQFTTDADETFVRLSDILTSQLNYYMLVEGTVLPSVFTPFATYALGSGNYPAPRKFEGQDIAVLGDSLSVAADRWWSHIVSPLGLRNWSFLDNSTGAVEERLAVSGASIERRESYGLEGGTDHSITHLHNRVQYIPTTREVIYLENGTNGRSTPFKPGVTASEQAPASLGDFATEWNTYYAGGAFSGTPDDTTTNGALILALHKARDRFPAGKLRFIGPPPRVDMYARTGKIGRLFSVTADASTDIFTIAGHGLASGDPITFHAGTMPTGINRATEYYVRDITTDTFKIASTVGGSAINITSNGSSLNASIRKVNLIEYDAILANVCKYMKVPYFCSLDIGVDPVNATNYAANYEDTTHLSAAGHLIWARAILAWEMGLGL